MEKKDLKAYEAVKEAANDKRAKGGNLRPWDVIVMHDAWYPETINRLPGRKITRNLIKKGGKR